MDMRWSQESRDQLAKSIIKEQPDFIERQILIKEEMICDSKKDIKRLQSIKDALISRDSNYLDNLVKDFEKSSREYIRQLLES